MTPTEILPILTEWRDTIQHAERELDAVLAPLILIPESPLFEIQQRLMDAFTASVAAQVGDQDEWMSWYRFDNDWGKKAFECAPPGGKPRKVRTLRNLARLIVESNRSGKITLEREEIRRQRRVLLTATRILEDAEMSIPDYTSGVNDKLLNRIGKWLHENGRKPMPSKRR